MSDDEKQLLQWKNQFGIGSQRKKHRLQANIATSKKSWAPDEMRTPTIGNLMHSDG